MKNILFIIIALTIGFTSCNNETSEKEEQSHPNNKPIVIKSAKTTPISLDDSTTNVLIEKGKWLTKQIKYAYKTELHNIINAQGKIEAINFCSDRAIKLSDSLSIVHQVSIKRSAKKNRNPVNALTEKENEIYKNYVISWVQQGEVNPRIDVNEKHQPVYYDVIYMTPFCLNCHGNLESDISPEIAERINKLYPEDKAVNFKVTEPRGMWVITFPEYYVK